MAALRHVGDDVPYGGRVPPCGLGNALRMVAVQIPDFESNKTEIPERPQTVRGSLL